MAHLVKLNMFTENLAVIVKYLDTLNPTPTEAYMGNYKSKYGAEFCITGKDKQLYNQWLQMGYRTDPLSNDPLTETYRNNGICRCPEWNDFGAYAKYAYANGYAPGLSTDRIDNLGDYEPGNVEYVTKAENSRRGRDFHRHPRAVSGISRFASDNPKRRWRATSPKRNGHNRFDIGVYWTHFAACYAKHANDVEDGII